MNQLKIKIKDLANSTGANKSKIPTEVLSELLFYRLAIARLGEEDNNAWWESNILSETCRRNLDKFLPNTFEKQRYDIARKIIHSKENLTIESKRYISLFNFGYKFETEIFKPFVEDIALKDEWVEILKSFENIKGMKYSKSWAREFFSLDKLPIAEIKENTSVEIGGIKENFFIEYSEFVNAVKEMLAVYDFCRVGKLYIPYFTRKVAI